MLGGTGAARFTLRLPSGRHPVHLRVGGLHNVYNAVGAAAGAVAMGLPAAAIVAGLEATKPAWSRGEVVRVDGVDVVLLLLKDAIGGSLLVRTLLEEDGPLDLLLAGDVLLDFPPDLPFLWDLHVDELLARLRTRRLRRRPGAAVRHVAQVRRRRHGAWSPASRRWRPACAGPIAGSAGRLHVVARLSAALELQVLLAGAPRVEGVAQ